MPPKSTVKKPSSTGTSSDPLRGNTAASRGVSTELFELVRSIGEAKSKHDEQVIIEKEAKLIKGKIGDANLTSKRTRDLLVRLLYVDMLGHDSEFGHIHAINMTQQANIMDKRVGYLVAMQCLSSSDSELRLMLVNSYRRDLQSTNHLYVAAALGAMANLVTPETVPAVLDLVLEALKHPKELVRKKAVAVVQRFNRVAPEQVSHLEDTFRRVVCDPSPAVMGTSLSLFQDLVTDSPNRFRDLVPSFLSILKQVVENRLPSDFCYHGIPSPWIQIKLLRIIAHLGKDNVRASELCYSTLREVLRKTVGDSMTAAAACVAFECVRTVTTIVPNPPLLDASAAATGRFLGSASPNLRYLGITALAWIVHTSPHSAVRHQIAVVACLESADETLRRKTLDLLYKMTNPANVEEVVSRLLHHLKETSDRMQRQELVQRITQLAERFAPSSEWFLATLTAVFETAGELVRPAAAHSLMRLIAEGTGENEEADMEMRAEAAHTFLNLLATRPTLPPLLVQVCFWVVGEYAYLLLGVGQGEYGSFHRINTVCVEAAERLAVEGDSASLQYAITCFGKLSVDEGRFDPLAEALLRRLAGSHTSGVDVIQRCSEMLGLFSTRISGLIPAVLPQDASCEDIDVMEPDEDGFSLSAVVDAFVGQAREDGAADYVPREFREDVDTTAWARRSLRGREGAKSVPTSSSGASGLKTAAYATPQPLKVKSSTQAPRDPAPEMMPSKVPTPQSSVGESTTLSGKSSSGLVVSTRRWGKGGYAGVTPRATSSERPASPVGQMDGEKEKDKKDRSRSSSAASDSVGAPTAPVGGAPVVGGERERLASALFSGIGGTAAPGSPSRFSRNAAPVGSTAASSGARRLPQKAAVSVPKGSAASDLMDLDFGAGPIATADAPSMVAPQSMQPAQPVDSFEEDMDLISFDPLDGMSSSAPPVASTAHAAVPMERSPSPSLIPSTVTPVASSRAVTTSSGEDTMSPMLVPAVVVPVAHPPAHLSGSITLPDSIWKALGSSSPFQRKEWMTVAEEEFVALRQNCQHSGSQLSLLLALSASVPLFEPSLSLRCPNHVTVLSWGNSPSGSVVVDGSSVSIRWTGKVSEPAFVVLRLALVQSTALTSSLDIRGTLSCAREDRIPTFSQFVVPFSVLDFVRPEECTVQQFGQQWKTHAQERVIRIQSAAIRPATVSNFAKSVVSLLHFSVVQTIDREVIAAARLITSGATLLVFLHARVGAARGEGLALDLKFRARDRVVLDAVASECERVLDEQ